MSGVSLRHINKIYPGGVKAVNDFCLEIKDKEFVILVGPSGCGKSTVIRMIAGLEDITDGELYIGDRLVNNVEARDRNIAMVFQNYALYPHMTGYQNMAFGLTLRHTPFEEIEERVGGAAIALNITELLERTPDRMSGGQRQRIALGRAIVRKPRVFLLDEPLSNLDSMRRVAMRAEITRIHRELATTFIYVTHDQTEAMTMGTRIVVMRDGIIQQADAPQNLYDYPVNYFVAGFIGTPQMNFINTVLAKEDDRLVFELGATKIKLSAEKSESLKSETSIGAKVIMGIRPEDIKCDEESLKKNIDAQVSGEIDFIENLGNEYIVHFKVSGNEDTLIFRTSSRSRLKAGEQVKLAISTDNIHLFDSDTHLTLLKKTR